MAGTRQSGFVPASGLSLLGKPAVLQSGHGALLTFLPMLGLTLWLWWSAQADVTRQAHERFEFRISEVQFAIQQRLLAYEHVLRGGVGLFAASDTVTRDEWATYVHNLDINKNYPGIQGIGFSLRVSPDQRRSHIASLRAQGFPNYTLWPEGDRNEYTAILYLEPFDWRNQRAFGYDMFSEPVRHAAMVRARDTGLPSISGRVTLVQETNERVQHGFLMYLPAYPKGVTPQTLAERHSALLGYVYSPFRMDDLMQGILGRPKLPDIRLQIYDGHNATSDHLMYDSTTDAPAPTQAMIESSRAIDINGSQWMLRFGSLPAFDVTIDRNRPNILLISGLLVSSLLAAVIWALSLNRRRARELETANRGLQREIVERQKLSQQLEHARDAAETANQAKSKFLANVSHELRTPLTLILAPLDKLLADARDDAERQHALSRIQRNALLLLERVSGLLDFAKAESGKLELNRETIDLHACLEPPASDAAIAAQIKGCTLDYRIDPELGPVYLDPRHFETIVMNLIGNALKFTPEHGSIRIEVHAIDGDRFELSVHDTGPGIAPEQQELLFRRFQQINDTAARRHGGTGLGLALVKELTELMGGEVGLDSTPGQGSRFFVRLPRGSDSLDTLKSATQPTDTGNRRFRAVAADSVASTDQEPVAGRPEILVVDDTPDMLAYLTELLAGEFTIHTATDGLQAWQLLQRQPMDLVVSDVMMSELDGLGLTARIKSSPTLAHLPVLLVTARGGVDARTDGLEQGADDYIAKPFSEQELRARVHAALRMARIQTQLREQSHAAGMAMLASSALHNIGNVLNSIMVSTGLVHERATQSRIGRLKELAALCRRHADNLPAFLAEDPAGTHIPDYLDQLGKLLEQEQSALVEEIHTLCDYAEQAARFVTSHQRFVRTDHVLRERVSASAVLEEALELVAPDCKRDGIRLVRHYGFTQALTTERYKLLHILHNLLSNACQALQQNQGAEKRLNLRTALADGRVLFEVCDNGVGIAPEAMARLFRDGYSTKGGNRGFGLHYSATWARELGGTLNGTSAGPGQGACFSLALPLE